MCSLADGGERCASGRAATGGRGRPGITALVGEDETVPGSDQGNGAFVDSWPSTDSFGPSGDRLALSALGLVLLCAVDGQRACRTVTSLTALYLLLTQYLSTTWYTTSVGSTSASPRMPVGDFFEERDTPEVHTQVKYKYTFLNMRRGWWTSCSFLMGFGRFSDIRWFRGSGGLHRLQL